MAYNVIWAAVEKRDLEAVNKIIQTLTPTEKLLILKTPKAERKGWTVLHEVAYHNCHKFMDNLLADLSSDQIMTLVRCGDATQWTPVIYAAARNSSETMRKLLSKVGNEEVLELLTSPTVRSFSVYILDHCGFPRQRELIKVKDRNGCNIFHRAAEHDNVHLVRYFFIHFCDTQELYDLINAVDGNGNTPLHVCVQKEHIEILKFLLYDETRLSGEQVYQLLRTSTDRTVLHQAAGSFNLHAMKMILEYLGQHRACQMMEVQNNSGQTALHSLVDDPRITKRHLKMIFVYIKKCLGKIILLKDKRMHSIADKASMHSISDKSSNRAKAVTKFLTKRFQKASEMYLLHQPPQVLVAYTTKDRPQAEDEKNSIIDAFTAMGIAPTVIKDPTEVEILKEINTFKQQPDLSALIVVIMAHGDKGVIYVRDKSLLIRDIQRHMNSSDLKGIPKVLILQSCQGDREAVKETLETPLETPGTSSTNVPSVAMNMVNDGVPEGTQGSTDCHIEHTDFLFMSASLHGQQAAQNLFIPIFANELKKSTDDEDLAIIYNRLHKIMRDERDICQIPVFRSTHINKFCMKSSLWNWETVFAS